MVSITDSTDMNLHKLQEMENNWGGWCAVVHGVAKSWAWLSDSTTQQIIMIKIYPIN